MLTKAVETGVPVFQTEYLGMGYRNASSIKAVGTDIEAHVSIYTLVFGRHPGGKQPPSGYIEGTTTPTPLMQWCMDKLGVAAKEARGVSFVVARSIKEHGNQVYQGKRPPVPTESTVEQVTESLLEQVNEKIKDIFNL